MFSPRFVRFCHSLVILAILFNALTPTLSHAAAASMHMGGMGGWLEVGRCSSMRSAQDTEQRARDVTRHWTQEALAAWMSAQCRDPAPSAEAQDAHPAAAIPALRTTAAEPDSSVRFERSTDDTVERPVWSSPTARAPPAPLMA
jgi:hypothetical protein